MNDADNLRQTTVHRSALRPMTFMGVEREPGLLAALVFVLMCYSALVGRSWTLVLIAIALWFVMFGALQIMSKVDPMMRRVYWRHVRYQVIYRSHSTPFRTR